MNDMLEHLNGVETHAIIYISDEITVKLDHDDYEWAVRYRWYAKPNQTKTKFYACRNTRLDGRAGKQSCVFMHKEILQRSGKKRRSKDHTLGDHKNGDSLDNRRENLRWATHSMNSRNRRKA